MTTYRLRWSFKSWGPIWGSAALAVLMLIAYFGTGLAELDRPGVWLFVALLLGALIGNGLSIRRIMVGDDGSVALEAPFRRIKLAAASIDYLSPAFSFNLLELGYQGGRCKLLDDFDDLDGFEHQVGKFNNGFRGRHASAA